MSRTILMTGAAGKVAGMLRPLLRARYEHLVLSDVSPVDDLADGESFRAADLAEPKAVRAACEGVDGIIHLGGQSREADWEVIDRANVTGLVTLFEAARDTGVPRIVFASSNHTVGMYARNRRIGTGEKVRPDSYYGLSKAFGEALAALFADKHGLRCLSIRIGNVDTRPIDRRRLSIWIHPEDLVQLCAIGLEHPDLHHEVVYGVSDNARTFWDNATAYRLGYRPAHRAEDHAAAALEAQARLREDPLAERFQGGEFCSEGFDGDAERTVWN